MDFADYRRDPISLEDMVRSRMTTLGVAQADEDAVYAMLAPLGAKREAGQFHRDHSLRVGLLASEIAFEVSESRRLRQQLDDARPLFFAGLLHDVGKALVPACTLCATERWTADDQREMEKHVVDGFRMLRDRFDFTAHVIVWHHRFQRGGYPAELPAPLQPFSDTTLKKAERAGELLMVADVFDAMHRVNSATRGRALSSTEIKQKMLALHPERLGNLIPRLYEKGVLR
jgi:HD-GYP domain-containing protein (c-di-GMP phosphodiesterase class II)